MRKIDKNKIDSFYENIDNKRIAVVGDIMVDIYFWGKTNRISPEAPVPVVDIYKEEIKPGGAANVALNIKSLGAKAIMFGIIGSDRTGEELLESFKNMGIDSRGIVVSSCRSTTTKARVLAAGQHVVRYDKEIKDYIDKDLEDMLIDRFRESIDSIDAVIIEDYNKGVLTPRVIREVIAISREKNKIIAIDPKFDNIDCYEGATIFKPNLKEAEVILNKTIETDSDIEKAGLEIISRLKIEYLIITLSERGMALFTPENRMKIIPTKALKVANVSGAGDTVIATLVTAFTGGLEFFDASTLANYAASVVVEDLGIVPIAKEALYNRLVQFNMIEA
ncbi:MAG: D-glycero-beta-D-manno-heptose-7-phosphate kinase [Candidatus Cloacimonadota bacterium]|nr:MAG: D-glycero-beta-D-manno-heptose-7-phosphate kinase [Candidatus Cloacimonadota bacterium]PIE77641.1 MAG: D-glycero-beta-D-manno-heptose-7-phosphate kinase [Candidatus Delongbacteria bacterium]